MQWGRMRPAGRQFDMPDLDKGKIGKLSLRIFLFLYYLYFKDAIPITIFSFLSPNDLYQGEIFNDRY